MTHTELRKGSGVSRECRGGRGTCDMGSPCGDGEEGITSKVKMGGTRVRETVVQNTYAVVPVTVVGKTEALENTIECVSPFSGVEQ